MKSFKLIGLSVLVAAGLSSCSTSKTVVSNGEYDDMYATSSDAPVSYSPSVARNSNAYAPEYLADYNDAFDRLPADSSIEGTDTYYDENYVNSRNLKRAYTPDAGYSSGYADGYSEGWNNYAWSGSGNRFNSWNSFYSPYGFNSFGYSPFGYSAFGNGFGSYLSYSPFIYGGYYGLNSFAYGGSFGYSPFGYSSFGYSPWGYSSYGYYGGAFGNPYYAVQPVFANGSFNDSRFGGSRSYGPRNGGRSTGIYNDGFVNTRRPTTSASASTRRVASGTNGGSTTYRGSSVADRANGRVLNTPSSSGRTYTSSNRRPASYDAYTSSGSSTRSLSPSSTGGRSSSYSSPSSSSYSSPNSSRASTYSRASSGSRSYTPSNTGGSSRSFSPSSNNTYSRPSSTNNSSFSRPSTSSSGSSSYSGGSSSSSSSRGSSGGSSRGPR